MSVDVSVIIATYNVENYIQRSVDSALASVDVNVEVIIVDDCSTDNTWSLLQEIDDSRVHVYQLPQNSGPSVARNEALSHCKGEWVAVLDGDDAFEPQRLSRLLATARNKEADWVIDNLTIVQEIDDTRIPMFKNFDQYDTISLGDYIAGNRFGGKDYPLGYTKPFISRSFLEKHSLRYNPEIRIGEDYIFMAEALALGAKCITENSSGYLYTVRAGSISHRIKPEDIQVIQHIDAQFISKYPLEGKALKAQKKRQANLKEMYAFTLLVDAIKSKDLKGIFKSLLLGPTAPRHLSEAIMKRLKGRS